MNYVTDTHALLWWFTDSPKLGSRASEIFTSCERGESIIFVPSIVIAELISIFDKKRVTFDFENLFERIRESDNFILVALHYPILERMVSLKEVPELHDKIIASTAAYLDVPIISKDSLLQKLVSIKTVW